MSRVLKGSVSGDGSIPAQVVGINKPVIGKGTKSSSPVSSVNSNQSQSVTQSNISILSSPIPGMPGVLPGNVLTGQHQKSISMTTPSRNGSALMATPVVGSKASVNGATTQQGVSAAVVGHTQSNGLPPKMPISDGNPSTESTNNLANTKEKTPMCLVNELARFNKIQHTYTLIDEQGPAHKKVFFVKLKLGDEEYPASGPSIKKAQHAAAAIALEATHYKHPPPKPTKPSTTGGNPSITPTVQLNALAMKLGMPTVYRTLDQTRQINPPSLNFRGICNQRYHYPHYPRVFYVSLKVGQREFIGEGNTRQAARHNAADKALKVLTVIPITPEEVKRSHPDKNVDETGDDDTKKNDVLKSEISLVHEIALKRNMQVNFEVVKESGPPHMKTFITRCTCGDLATEGEGNSKKLSKKRSAEKMLEELNKLPPLNTTASKTKKNTAKKKNSRNLIKRQKADPDYGVGINPISRLIQIQQAKKEKEPVYTLIAEKGQPRRKEFVMQVTVGDRTCTGEGPNKKLAKRNAAEVMLQMLGYSRPAPQPSKPAIKTGDTVSPSTDKKVTFVDADNTSNARQVVPGVIFMPEAGSTMGAVGSSVFIKTHQVAGEQSAGATGDRKDSKYSSQATATIAKELLVTGCSPTAEAMKEQGHKDVLSHNVVRPKQQLLYLAEVLNFKVEFTDLPTKDNGYFSLVSLSTNPHQVSHGGGSTIEESHDMAALAALKALSSSGLNIITEAKEKDKNGNSDGLQVKKTLEMDRKENDK